MTWINRHRVCLGAVLVIASSCFASPQKVLNFSGDLRTYRAADYPEVHKAWTRHTRLVAYTIGLVFEGWATLKGPGFRQAYVAKYTSVYGLAETEHEALAKAQRQVDQAGYEIHLIAQSTSDKWIDLEKRTSPWRISLVDGTGAEMSPSLVRVEKYPQIYESVFFPDHTPFSRSYTIKFQKPEAGETFVGPTSGKILLRIASPLGQVDFTWQTQ